MLRNNVKRNTKCVVIGNNSNHNREIGSVVTINQPYFSGGGVVSGYTTVEFGTTWFALNDLKLWEKSREDLDEELSKYNAKITIINTQIDFMEEMGKKVVNSDEFKEYCLTKIVESDLTSREKAESIMELMDGNQSNAIKVIKRPKRKDIPEDQEVEEMEIEDSNSLE